MNSKRLAEMLVGLILLLAIGCAALAIYAGDRKAHHWGPRILEQAQSGEVWLVIDQDLFIASPDGVMRRHVPLAALNLPGPVNAIVPLPDGEGQARMLIGVINLPQWLVMDGDGRVVDRITPSGVDMPFSETFHLAVSPDGRIAMSSGGDHSVLLFDARGKFLARSESGLFRFANGLWFESGQWFVVDTNHHQVRRLNGETMKPEDIVPVPALGSAYWPALARRGKGGEDSITVSEMQNGMQYGSILEMSSSGKLLHEYRSQAAAPQPTDFLWLEERLLMADSDDFSLQIFDKGGKHLGSWGDAQIVGALGETHGQRRWWSNILLAAQAGALVLGMLAITGYFSWKRREAVVPAIPRDEERTCLGTPCVGKKDEFLGKIRLFWPLLLLIAGIVMIPQILILSLVIFAGGLKAALAVPWVATAFLAAGVLLAVLLVWLAFTANKVMRKRVHEPRFEAVLSSRWVRWAGQTRAVQDALEAGEQVQEVLMVYTTRLFPAFNMHVWVLTNRRLLIFSLTTGGKGKLQASAPRSQVRARIESTGGWFWWTEAFGKIGLQLADGRIFSGYPSSPVTAQRMADLLALLHVAAHPVSQSAPVPQAEVASAPRALHPAAAFLLSLLLPGAAQLMQNRFVLGLVLLTIMLVHVAFVLTPVLLGWLGHFYDVPLHSGLYPILFAAGWALLSAWDAWNYAHRTRPAAALRH